MRRIIRILLTCMLVGAAVTAQAQRTPVPVVNFEAIPVSLSTTKPVTADQVRQAWIAAGTAARWEVVAKQPGLLEATYRKGDKHTVVVEVTYDANAYSTRFVSSVNMKQAVLPPSTPAPRWFGNRHELPQAEDYAAKKQAEQFANHAEAPYAKHDPQIVIHPFCERWLYELLGGVRAQLRSVD